MIKQSRFRWVDLAKGIAIILMVMGHTSIPIPLSKFIWSFHMPLFYIVSGMLFHNEELSFRVFLNKIIFKLVIPYILFSIIVTICYFRTEYYDPSQLYKGWTGYALWFVPVLFFGELLLYYIAKTPNYIVLMISVLSILLGQLFNHYSIVLPYKINVVPFALFFLCVGYIFKNVLLKTRFNLMFIIILGFISIIMSQYLPKLDMCINYMGYVVPNLANALIGSVFVFQISKLLESNSFIGISFLEWCGKNTFFIMAFSQVLNYWVLTLLNFFTIPRFIALPLRYFLLFFLIWIIANFLKRFLPQFVGIK